MSQLCFYLPPFSSDYAGACSSLFDLGGMVVIHDGACCSRNYVGFDEPRWFGSRAPGFGPPPSESPEILGTQGLTALSPSPVTGQKMTLTTCLTTIGKLHNRV